MFCLFSISAERRGFEPLIRFWRIHAFQACLFNHSSTFPKLSHAMLCTEMGTNDRNAILLHANFICKSIVFFLCNHKKHNYSSKKVYF